MHALPIEAGDDAGKVSGVERAHGAGWGSRIARVLQVQPACQALFIAWQARSGKLHSPALGCKIACRSIYNDAAILATAAASYPPIPPEHLSLSLPGSALLPSLPGHPSSLPPRSPA